MQQLVLVRIQPASQRGRGGRGARQRIGDMESGEIAFAARQRRQALVRAAEGDVQAQPWRAHLGEQGQREIVARLQRQAGFLSGCGRRQHFADLPAQPLELHVEDRADVRVRFQEFAAVGGEACSAPALHVDQRRPERARTRAEQAPGVAVGQAGSVRGFAQGSGPRQRREQAEQRLAMPRRQALAREPARLQVHFGSGMQSRAYF